MRPIIESVRQCFLENYHPHKENAIDEAMVPFKGRSSLKQYVPLKPVRRGFKIWVRADSNNGYICDFSVYTGKEESTEKNLGPKVVKKLAEPLALDNFFSTVNLFDDLLEDGIYACGTFRRDRKGVPQAIKNVQLGKPHLSNYVRGPMFHIVPTCNCSVHMYTNACALYNKYRCIHTILIYNTCINVCCISIVGMHLYLLHNALVT